eukprot:1192771-Amphidinium_carterae.1
MAKHSIAVLGALQSPTAFRGLRVLQMHSQIKMSTSTLKPSSYTRAIQVASPLRCRPRQLFESSEQPKSSSLVQPFPAEPCTSGRKIWLACAEMEGTQSPAALCHMGCQPDVASRKPWLRAHSAGTQGTSRLA